MTIINMPDQATWYTMNMLKKSIQHMKKFNQEGKRDKAIADEEAILRSFFDALGRPEADAEKVAA